MLKRTLKIIAWTTGILLLIFGITFGVLYFRQDQIRALVFESINENLDTEINVAEAGVSLRKFPKAAIRLSQVHAAGSRGLNDTLFYVQNAFVAFEIWDIFGDDIPIQSISLENGELILLESAGQNNWSILKESSEPSQTALRLESIQLKDIRYRFSNEQNLVRGYLDEVKAQGLFGGADWGLSLDFQSRADAFVSEEEAFLVSPVILDGHADLKGADDLKIFAKNLRFGSIENLTAQILVEENITTSLKHENLDLVQLKTLYALIGEEWPEDFEIIGEAEVQVDLIQKPQQDLRTEVFAQASDLELQTPWYSDQKLSLRLEYYRQGKFDRLELREFNNTSKSRSLSGTIRQLQSPQMNLKLHLDEDIEDLEEFIPEQWSLTEGHINSDLKIVLNLKDWESLATQGLKSMRVQGDYEINDLDLQGPGELKLSAINSKGQLKGKNLDIDTLYFVNGDSDLKVKGRISEPLKFIADSTRILPARLVLKAENFILEDFMKPSTEEEEEESTEMTWNRRLDIQAIAHFHNFSLGNFQAKELKGQATITDKIIEGKNIKLIADGGTYAGRFAIRTPRDSTYTFSAQIKVQRVQVASVFRSFDDFNQETITADNLDGILSLDAKIIAPINASLDLDPQGLLVQSTMTIEEGHLKNYEPMQALSRFAEVEELEDVRFNTLSNTISISEGSIHIPEMTISSNVLNMDLSGKHSFENEIDYVITMRLGDVLFAKRDKKSSNSEFEEQLEIVKRDDDHRIPIHIGGTVDNPEISIDRSSLGKSFKESLKQQGQEIRNLFKKEEKKEQSTGLKFEWDEG